MIATCRTITWFTFAFTALFADSQAQIQVGTDFPGGSGEVLDIDQEQRIVRLKPDDHPGRGWRCWWYVRLSGLTVGQSITLDVGDAPWATPDQATVSTDNGRTWQHTEAGTRIEKRIRYVITPESRSLLVAWGPPFVPADAQALVTKLAATNSHAHAFVLCRTREGRNTPALRVKTKPHLPLVWIQARQHAWESGASWVCRGFSEWLLSDAAEAVQLRSRAEVVIVPVMDIDNVYRGAGGKNQAPQDHNRDWSDQPHWRAVAAAQTEIGAAAAEERLVAFIDLHNPAAGNRQPYYYIPPREILPPAGQSNLDLFLKYSKTHISGPLPVSDRAIESGPKYDPKMWQFISKNWVARLKTPAISATLETAWNTPNSTTSGYLTVGRQLGLALSTTLRHPGFVSTSVTPQTDSSRD